MEPTELSVIARRETRGETTGRDAMPCRAAISPDSEPCAVMRRRSSAARRGGVADGLSVGQWQPIPGGPASRLKTARFHYWTAQRIIMESMRRFSFCTVG
ncbi:hypothetical protein O0L34_g8414 [Tuta absoluta]|nr:hypothetical protein O0L34_g8414 [Tuta absoluta]